MIETSNKNLDCKFKINFGDSQFICPTSPDKFGLSKFAKD